MLELIWPSSCAGCRQQGRGRLCPSCRHTLVQRVPLSTEHLAFCLTLGGIDGMLGNAVRAAKYGSDRPLMWELGACLAEAIAPHRRHFDAVVPTPTTGLRQLRRGFSPAEILALSISRVCHLPIHRPLRLTNGPRQASLGASARKTALRGRVRALQAPAGRVLLVDDVVTTGATGDACARELLSSGSTQVVLATVCAARRPPYGISDNVRHKERPRVP